MTYSQCWPDVLGVWHTASPVALKFAIRKTERRVTFMLRQVRREQSS